MEKFTKLSILLLLTFIFASCANPIKPEDENTFAEEIKVGDTQTPGTQVTEETDIVDGTISAEVIALDAEGMLQEGRELVKIHKNIVIKVVFNIY